MILLFCILLNVLVAVVFKFFPVYGIDVKRAIVVNYLTCVATAYVTQPDSFSVTTGHLLHMLPWSVPMGLLFFAVFLVIGKTVANYGVMVSTTSQKLSLILPVIVAILFFDERLTVWKLAGILAAIMAVVFINSNGKLHLPKTFSTSIFSLPFLTWLGSSFVDLSLFMAEKQGVSGVNGLFFTASLFAAAGISGLVYVIINDLKTHEKWSVKHILAGIILGVPNFFSIYLIVVLLGEGWDGSVLFPVLNVAIILITSLLGIVVFKESFTANRKIGFLLAILAIILLSLPWK